MFEWLKRRRKAGGGLADQLSSPHVVKLKQGTEENPQAGNLLAAQRRIFDTRAKLTIVDVGVHLGHSSQEYLDTFPNCSVFGFEPEDGNFEKAAAYLASYGDRMKLLKVGLSDSIGQSILQVNSHDGTHSLLEIGQQRYWEGYAETVRRNPIDVVTLDHFCEIHNIQTVDILKMDIQGAELRALKGAEEMLRGAAVSLVALEVEFQRLYEFQPLFWDIGNYLQSFGYGFHGLFEPHYHSRNKRVLSWADAIFLAPHLLEVPEWEKVQSGGGKSLS